MLKLTENQKSDELVKSLLDSGFSEETIAGWINSGDITLKSEEPEDNGGEKPEGDLNGGSEGSGENQDPDEGANKDKKEKSEGCSEKGADEGADPKDPEEPIEKGVNSEDLMKSLSSIIAEREDLMKSIMEDSIKGVSEKIDSLAKSIDGLNAKIEALGDQAPAFKSAGLNRAVLEKSIGGTKDDNDKTILSVSRDRAVVRALIEKAIDEEKDEAIQKSLRDETLNYLIDPIGGAIGETAARYMYNSKNVRLVK